MKIIDKIGQFIDYSVIALIMVGLPFFLITYWLNEYRDFKIPYGYILLLIGIGIGYQYNKGASKE